MPLVSILLKSLLGALLLLNGVTETVGALGLMKQGHSEHLFKFNAANPLVEASGCRHHVNHEGQIEDSPVDVRDAVYLGHEECCQGSSFCQCTCLHLTSMMVPTMEWNSTVWVSNLQALPVTQGAAPVPQPSLFRPPIV